MEDKDIKKFMKEIKSYLEPISNLINFDGIENCLYAELIGDVEEDDAIMDFILTLVNFMLENNKRTKEETLKVYKIITDFVQKRLKELQMTDWLVRKRMYMLKEGKKTNE